MTKQDDRRCRQHHHRGPDRSWVYQQLRSNAIESVVFGIVLVGIMALGVWIAR